MGAARAREKMPYRRVWIIAAPPARALTNTNRISMVGAL
jgi:hypothetical protein